MKKSVLFNARETFCSYTENAVRYAFSPLILILSDKKSSSDGKVNITLEPYESLGVTQN